MSLPLRSVVAGLVLLTGCVRPASTGAAPLEGFTALFNGKDLVGWHGQVNVDPLKLEKLPEAERKSRLEEWTMEARKHWRLDGAELVADGKGPFLTSDRSHGDSDLIGEIHLAKQATAEVCLRATPNSTAILPSELARGEWIKFRIVQVGERLTVHVGNRKVHDHVRVTNTWNPKTPVRRSGPIQLRAEGGEVRWRNLFVRPIPAEEANRLLKARSNTGFEDVFNGKDFTGWDGPLDNYEIKDGAVFCKPKKGGNIYTKEQYDDFVARLEFRLPPGGNNGLALRYPGQGQASLLAMCEIQILDDDAPKYAKLDPRQANGSAYGMVAAHKGYLRPIDEWNFMEVTVRGSTIQIEQNGTRILDCDLSTVTKFMGGKPHPGKDRTTGHFGFCGHNDPVAFRHIQIRRLSASK